MSISEERNKNSAAKRDEITLRINTAMSLMDKGYSKSQIAREMNVSESTVLSLIDDNEMLVFDRYISEPEKLAIAKEFVGNMSDEHFERYKVLPFERKAYLLRLYAEKNHNTNLGIVPYIS